ncbi:pickpocket protein 19 isoform X2 [Drosophila biarmipes]|uniref:pickpocket protein 19 isoform X2 n=1 Tax=Drosophila biarmipes TaxID=125945 RepID=UPI0007E7965D|nr:pickpocket protein 19 isoform X2 [Drosophila biarmipes]
MFYPLELPRPRRPLYGAFGGQSGLIQTQKDPKDKSRLGRLWRFYLPYFKDYAEESSVHGIRYLADPKLRKFERFIWLLILIATSIGAILVYVDLNELYQSVRIQTTIKNTMLPIFRIPFPSIGLCPRNRLNWKLLENGAAEHFLGANVSAVKKDLFIKFFTAAGDPHLSRMNEMSRFFMNETLASNLHMLDSLNLRDVYKYIQFKCQDLFKMCRWRGNPVNCCDVFEDQFTESGLCFVFNTEISPRSRKRAKEDQFYPRRTAQYGEGTGLDVFLRLNRSLIRPGKRGINVMIKQTQQWSDAIRLVPPETHSRVSITPRYTVSSERTRSVPTEVRRCLFDDETDSPHYKNLPGFQYWVGNCRSRCHQEHVLDLCNCSPSIFFPFNENDNFTLCKPSDFKCLYDNRLTFSIERHPDENDFVKNPFNESMICDCFTSCTQLIFERVYTTNPLDNNETDTEAGTTRIDIFFQSGWFVQYQTVMRFTFVELLASFGGIIGLFLGASLLSGFELVYYFTIGLYMYVHDKREVKKPEPRIVTIPFGQRKITPIKYIHQSFNK